MIRVWIAGATGYAGAELVRLLLGHPQVTVVGLASERHGGLPVAAALPGLAGVADDLVLHEGVLPPAGLRADAALLALPPGPAMTAVPGLLEAGVRVVDLGPDFRLGDPETYFAWYGRQHQAPALLGRAVYGLPEWFGDALPGARLVANPGCYPTAAVLAAGPLVRAGLAAPDGIIVDAKSGLSGAGRSPAAELHFAEANENVRAYQVGGTHRHTPEIEQALEHLAGRRVRVTFTPHLVPMTRGILATLYASLNRPIDVAGLVEIYRAAYAGAPFVRVLDPGRLPATKAVLGSNFCDLGLAVDGRTGRAVVLAALDNLGKGAAGQAIQNLNLMFGLAETAGLRLAAVYP